MIAAFSPFLALRYLVTRRINLLGVFGVSFAVWAMIVVNSVFTGFVTEINADVARSAPDLLVTDLPHDTGYETLRAAIERDEDVAATAPRLRHHGLCQPLRVPRSMQTQVEASQVDFDHTRSGFALLLGIDPIREAAVTDLRGWLDRATTTIRGHTPLELPPSTVLDEKDPARRALLQVPDDVEWRGRARAGMRTDGPAADHRSTWPGILFGWRRIYDVPWLRDGDAVDLLTASFVAAGDGQPQVRTHRVRMAFAGFFATGHRTFDAMEALVPIETLRTALGHDIADPGAIDLVTDVAIRVRPGRSARQIAACQQRLRDAVQACLPKDAAPCSVLDWQQQNPVFLSAVAHEHAMMKFVLFVVMIVAAFVIYATLHMMVVQKWKDVGILAALGGTPSGIGAVFLLCGFVVGVIGAVLGALMGTLSVHWLNDFNAWLYEATGLELFPRALFDLQGVPVCLEASWLVQVAASSLLLALFVAWVPSRKAARMNPVKALSYE